MKSLLRLFFFAACVAVLIALSLGQTICNQGNPCGTNFCCTAICCAPYQCTSQNPGCRCCVGEACCPPFECTTQNGCPGCCSFGIGSLFSDLVSEHLTGELLEESLAVIEAVNQGKGFISKMKLIPNVELAQCGDDACDIASLTCSPLCTHEELASSCLQCVKQIAPECVPCYFE